MTDCSFLITAIFYKSLCGVGVNKNFRISKFVNTSSARWPYITNFADRKCILKEHLKIGETNPRFAFHNK
jgi:hypothetical protein